MTTTGSHAETAVTGRVYENGLPLIYSFDKSIEFVRAAAEGELVALHTHQSWPGNAQYVTMDLFRFDHKGKIVEQWDSIQEVPEETRNGNSMY